MTTQDKAAEKEPLREITFPNLKEKPRQFKSREEFIKSIIELTREWQERTRRQELPSKHKYLACV
jgi:hypothetical protein